MDEVVIALRDQLAELSGLLAQRDDADFAREAPRCPGWTVADVVLHLAQTDEFAIASAEGRLPKGRANLAGPTAPVEAVDDTAALMVERERGKPASVVRDRWQASADALVAVLDATDLHTRVRWVAGEISARTLATTRIAETWIHTGDVAEAFGVTLTPTNRLRLIARLAWRTLPYAFGRAGRALSGPVAFELTGPSGETWVFVPDEEPKTVIRGDALDLCLVAARRAEPSETGLQGEGPDTDAVLELVRTYA